jgi:hypothetical protein
LVLKGQSQTTLQGSGPAEEAPPSAQAADSPQTPQESSQVQ